MNVITKPLTELIIQTDTKILGELAINRTNATSIIKRCFQKVNNSVEISKKCLNTFFVNYSFKL